MLCQYLLGTLSSINQNTVKPSFVGPFLSHTTQNIIGSASPNVSSPVNPVETPDSTECDPKPIGIQLRGRGRPRKASQQNQKSLQTSTNVPMNPTTISEPNVSCFMAQTLRNTPDSIHVGSSSPNLYTPDITHSLRPIVATSKSKYYSFKFFGLNILYICILYEYLLS